MTSKPASHIVLIGDVGGWSTYHVGDEAMLSANIASLRRWRPTVRLTVLSRDPSWSRSTYAVDSILPFGFPSGPEEAERREQRLSLITGCIEQDIGKADDRISDVLGTIREADALFISGGGNLCSSWPEHLYERVALMRAAYAFGKPVIVSGQTLGPAFTPGEREMLSHELRRADFVGLRERDSFAVAVGMGVPPDRLFYQLDDAFFIARRATFVDPPLRKGSFIAVTFHPHSPGQYRKRDGKSALVQQLERISRFTGRTLVFVPHQNGIQREPATDRHVGAMIASEIQVPFRLLPPLVAEQAATVAADAELIISSRYHPLVFGVAGCVPSLGIWMDEYTRIKISGALAHGGLEQWVLSDQDLVDGELEEMAMRLWVNRGKARDSVIQLAESWRTLELQKWDRIHRILDGAPRTMSQA